MFLSFLGHEFEGLMREFDLSIISLDGICKIGVGVGF